jgi:hypothetical protein
MLLIRRILTSQWDEASRPIAKPELNQRLAALRAPLGFLSLEPHEPELRLLHNRFDTWHGIGDIVAGMVRHEYDLDLRRYNGHGWRAMFVSSGFEHSLIANAGSAWAPSPWEAAQRAARDALRRREAPERAPRDWTTVDDARR